MKIRWVEYYICDSSGVGFNNPNYCYFISNGDDKNLNNEYIKEYILDTYESWAHDCTYSLKYNIDINPPKDILEKELLKIKNRIKNLTEIENALEISLKN